jgi:serine/alanine adding enzyme
VNPTRPAEAELELSVSDGEGLPPDWDRFVESEPGGTYCHFAGWSEIMRGVLGHDCLYAWAHDSGGSLAGILPLVSVRSLLFGRFLVSMPFLNYGGPVGKASARELLAAWAVERARGTRVDLLELRSRSAAGDPPVPHPEVALTERKVSVVLELPDDPEVLWEDGLRSKVRSQVRRPMKEGLEARFGAEQVAPFYEVFVRNMRDLGTPVLPRGLFEALPRVFGERVEFGVIYLGDEPVAAGCGFECAGEFEITWASSLREHSRVAPNMLLYWRFMERAIERGAGAFNFGRCTPDSGSHRFKSQWGGVDEPLPWTAWSPSARTATPNPDQGKYALAVRAWQRLPLEVTRVLGPPLARRIP